MQNKKKEKNKKDQEMKKLSSVEIMRQVIILKSNGEIAVDYALADKLSQEQGFDKYFTRKSINIALKINTLLGKMIEVDQKLFVKIPKVA